MTITEAIQVLRRYQDYPIGCVVEKCVKGKG